MPVHAAHLIVRLALAAAAGVAWLLTLAAPGAGSPTGPPALLPPGADAAACPWIVPVDAPVVDGFRPPPNPYGPGNRGLEYGVTAGQPVVAVAAGRVGFVGPVAGRRYVVVEHSGGLRSTYGPLASVAVVRGQQLAAGEGIGEAAPGLLLTARLGSGPTQRYIDPAPLLAGRCGRVRLVPDRPVAARDQR
ncbi:MAG: M23 family metallopeptidase [Acidimicrobiales bacterium]